MKTIGNAKWVPVLTTATEKSPWEEEGCEALNKI